MESFPIATWLADTTSLLGAAAALYVVAQAGRAWYRRTFGRRRDRYARLARLGPQAHLSFFESVLGEPPAIRRTLPATVQEYNDEAEEMMEVERFFLETIFIDRDYYVQAICDAEETVLGFSVTTRSARFRPTFSFPGRIGLRERRQWEKRSGLPFEYLFKVSLGRTRFSALPWGDWTPNRRTVLGARPYAYTELYYFGNPGYYQSFGFTASSAAPRASVGAIGEVVEESGWGWAAGSDQGSSSDLAELPALRAFRQETVVTTFTLLGPHISLERYPDAFGPHGDEVRVLP